MSINEVIMLCENDLPPKPEKDCPDESNSFHGYIPNKKAA
jgi:hypothetical protein